MTRFVGEVGPYDLALSPAVVFSCNLQHHVSLPLNNYVRWRQNNTDNSTPRLIGILIHRLLAASLGLAERQLHGPFRGV